MTFAEHYHELASRVFRITGTVLIAFSIASGFPDQCDSAFYALIGRLAGAPRAAPLIVFVRWMWAAAVAFLIGFWQLVRQLSACVEPGLYTEEIIS